MKDAPHGFSIASIARLPPERPRHTPPLDPVREHWLVETAQAGDEAARAELLDAFAPLVRAMSRQFGTTGGAEHPELMQAGAVGLLRALDRYDAARGTPFWAYASWWVHEALQSVSSALARPALGALEDERDTLP